MNKTMTIKKALKEKNRLIKEIKDAFEIIKTQNSIEVGNTRRYSIAGKVLEVEKLTKELVDLKVRIHTANLPVYGKIFELSELKSNVSQLKSMNVEEGKVVTGGYASIIREKVVEVNANEKDNLIKNLENRITLLQDELDVYNAITII
jgi:hypothetical protein